MTVDNSPACDIERFNVTDIDGNAISLEGETEEAQDVTMELNVDDDGMLSVTSDDLEEALLFEPVQDDPRDVMNCDDSQ